MKRYEYTISVEETKHFWTLWLQEQQGVGEEFISPIRKFQSDREMFSYMSSEGWELITSAAYDGAIRFIFKRRLK